MGTTYVFLVMHVRIQLKDSCAQGGPYTLMSTVSWAASLGLCLLLEYVNSTLRPSQER